MSTYDTDVWIVVVQDPDEDYGMIVKSTRIPGIEEKVYTGPNPTWPTPAEQHDAVADAVRRMLDRGWEHATGEPVVR